MSGDSEEFVHWYNIISPLANAVRLAFAAAPVVDAVSLSVLVLAPCDRSRIEDEERALVFILFTKMGEREVDEFPVGSLGWAKVEGTVQRQLEKLLCLLIEQVLVRRQCHLQMLNDSDTDRSRANENWAEGNDDREWETIEMNYKWQWHPIENWRCTMNH